MSDSSRDLADHFERNVFFHQQPRSTGLFTIPEYPELEAKRGMWSAAIEAILTTLRYLAPATLLTLFWGQQSFLFRLLKHIDSAFRAIVFSSEEQKEIVLQWLAETGPVKVEHLDTVWRHGWILCGVLDAALPGACAGHPPTSMSLKHAQAIADHYLGVEPVFSRSELDLNDSISRHQEWKLTTYLDRIRQALEKITPPVSKPISQRTSPETTHFTLDYVAKGSGLTAAQVNHKMHFKIYPTSQQALDPGEITILIRGPKDTYGMAVLPPTLGKAQLIRQKLLGLQSKQTYTENVLPITQGATYLRSYGRNDMNKTYFIPKTRYEIEIEAEPRPDHLKISYEVSIEGKYEISITSRGQSIVGSPFSVTACNNIIGILERDSFCLEDGEEIDIVDVKTDRKVVLRIVDFVTEKMLLKENGTLEKISDDEVKILMATDIKKPICDKYNIDNEISAVSITDDCDQINKNKFNMVGRKILTMNRICKIFNDVMIEKQKKCVKPENPFICQRSSQDIPDIVNSTFTENNINQYVSSEKRDKFIIPESISVSLRTEKSKSQYDEEISNASIEIVSSAVDIPKEIIDHSSLEFYDNTCMENFFVTPDEQLDDETISVDRMTTSSNPFLSHMCEENFIIAEKDLGTFVTSEYETNNSQNEETRDSSIRIFIETPNSTPSPMQNNPFIDTDITKLERPKTPVYKIIAGEEMNRHDSVFIDPKTEHPSYEILGNEFVNPFFMHQHIIKTDQHKIDSCQSDISFPVADFIIGAPVSLPPIIRAPSPQPNIKSTTVTNKEKNIKKNTKKQESSVNDISETVFPTNIITGKRENNSSVSSNSHSLESNLTDTSNPSTSDSQFDPYRNYESNSNRNVSPKKDTWDSAYVSIDDNNSSPDTNNNENTLCETHSKHKFSPSDVSLGIKREELSNMGPAERELWQTCSELKDNDNEIQEVKPNKWEIKRPTFTPIIEESDRNISSGMKDLSRTGTKCGDADCVTVAFAELNDMYQEYFPCSKMSSTTTANDGTKLQSMEVESKMDTKDVHVNSASELLSDVKRHEETTEGTISEVQTNVTESFSASQTLHNNETDQATNFNCQNKNETQFGDGKYSNIVLERKKYWDEKIRQIQAKTEETIKYQRKRSKISSKQLKHNDSLTKRRGKQIIKNFLNAGDHQFKQAKSISTAAKQSETVTQELITQGNIEDEQLQSEEKLVEKWKKYWDDKLEIEHNETELINLIAISPKEKKRIATPEGQQNEKIKINENTNDPKDQLTIPIKQELPEEVFRAFETSPKRFFGTSRKQILNKIDIFLGKPTVTEENLSVNVDGMRHESGLVSSRISMFHNLSHTEELPWVKKQCLSLNNISNRKDSVKSDNSEDIIIIEKEDDKDTVVETEPPKTTLETRDTTIKEQIESNLVSQYNTSLQNKRVKRAQKMQAKSFDESEDDQTNTHPHGENKITYVKNPARDHKSSHIDKYKKNNLLRRTSISKSEMDIFNKVPNQPDVCIEKYKSCDELPKTNVKSFISLYESVTKTAAESKPVKRMYRTSSIDSQKHLVTISTPTGAVSQLEVKSSISPEETNSIEEAKPKAVTLKKQWLNRSSETVSSDNSIDRKTHNYFTDAVNEMVIRSSTPVKEIKTPKKLWLNRSSETVSSDSIDWKTNDTDSFDIAIKPSDDKETTYHSLSDIELEIVECSPDKSSESPPERTKDPAHIEYKSRFKSAKQFFQSLEELRDVKKTRKLNECELLLNNKSTESLEIERPQKRVKKNIKSHSMPSSEISKVWNELQGNADSDSCSTKLVKISEKFNVDDLFTDVMEGRLSRQGSLRGIPHKKAVLEAFRSMENIADGKMSPYELAVTQLNDFAKENKIKNAQTYLSEYPYLPTTDPSKYHSRLDAKASGLISFKELLGRKPRRNSVPDLRLNLKFEVDL